MSGLAEIEEMQRESDKSTDRILRMSLLGGLMPAWPEWVVRTVRNPVRGSRLSKRERRSRKMWWGGS